MNKSALLFLIFHIFISGIHSQNNRDYKWLMGLQRAEIRGGNIIDFVYKINIDSRDMDRLKIQFRSLSGRNDQMVERWADIYTMYIDFLQKGEVAETNKVALLAYSRECADKYGDAIHLARSMANTFDKTYFDVFDDCPELIRLRAASNSLNAIVQPNPTKGELNIVLENPFTGTIEMFDITGKLVYIDRCENIFEKTIHLNLNEGVFMEKITSVEGDSDIEKVLITK